MVDKGVGVGVITLIHKNVDNIFLNPSFNLDIIFLLEQSPWLFQHCSGLRVGEMKFGS